MTVFENMTPIGGIEELKTKNGITYTEKFLIQSENPDLYLPEIGSPADWASESAIITKIQKTWYAKDSWLIQLTAEETDENDFFLSIGENRLESYVEKNFSITDLYFKPEWWGLRVASLADCAEFLDNGSILQGERKYYNCNGQWANPGDYIFNNSKPLYYSPISGALLQSAVCGTANYSLSPFTENSNLSARLIGQILKTRLYQCVFYCSREPGKISDFSGISGDFRNSCSPGSSVTGKWKAIDQQVRRIRTVSGKLKTRVKRTMVEAPDGMFWDPEKNGGYWSW